MLKLSFDRSAAARMSDSRCGRGAWVARSGWTLDVMAPLGLPSYSRRTTTKNDFIASVRFRHPSYMPVVVIAALWLSIVLVLGILVWWEYKRFVNKRRMRLPGGL